MGRLIMLVGLPASGKSTYTETIVCKNKVVISSDTLREELFGNRKDTEHNNELFQELHKRVKKNLIDGKDVIYDATNISSKRRRNFLKELSGAEYNKVIFECHYIPTNYHSCLLNNIGRHYDVSTSVISRMYHQLQIPMYHEGWDVIKIVEHGVILDNHLDKIIQSDYVMSYDELYNILLKFNGFNEIYELPHDNLNHTLSVSRHTYEVYKTIKTLALNKQINNCDVEILLLASMFHDVGKGRTKEFREDSKYANFIGHENISAQMTIHSLIGLYNSSTILQVAELVQLHMRLLNNPHKDRLYSLIDDITMERLLILSKADREAH